MAALIADVNSQNESSSAEQTALRAEESAVDPSAASSEKVAKPAKAASRRARNPEKEFRIAAQPGFVLHSYPYKETSLIVDVFSRDHGRIALVAKGAKRPHSQLRGVLQTFQPLSLIHI